MQIETDVVFSCNECGFYFSSLLKEELIIHDCFLNFNENVEVFAMNDNNQLFVGKYISKLIASKLLTVLNNNQFFFIVPKAESLKDVNPSKSTIIEEHEEENFILAVKNKPMLYMHGSKVKDRTPLKMKNLWQEICVELGKPVGIYKDVANHWHGLRNKYIKARKNLLTKPKSGSAAKPKKKNKCLLLPSNR